MRAYYRPLLVFTIVIAVLLLMPAVSLAQSGEILVLEADGPVTPAMASYFERGVRAAESDGAAALVIVLDTPGGNVDPMQDIVRAFRGAKVPVIVYVSPSGAQAASAGSVIAIAAHFAAMAPETVIGAASPVGEGGADLDETIFRKLTEDLSAQVRSLTERRGAAATELAEAMILDARAVNDQEALDVGLIDAVAEDLDDLLLQLDGREALIDGQAVILDTAEATRRDLGMNAIEQALHALSNPLLVSILLVIGVQAILIELGSPGGWVAGFIGVLALGLGLYGLGQLPANWLGLGLIAVAFVLFALEVKAATHGALALAGTATMLAGLLVLFNSPGTPEFARISIPSAVVISLSTAAFFIFVLAVALRAQRAPTTTGGEGLLGQTGMARTKFTSAEDHPPYSGMLLVHGELWRATSNEPIEIGEEATISGRKGFTVHVEKG